VTPTFDWIRLAQRFPVRVRLKELPPEVDLRVGLTASVQVMEAEEAKKEGR
jgi:multidrug resistance efflux pump